MEYKNIFDLNDKINLIYDYLYNINTKNCFLVNKITMGNINIDDIKLISNNNTSNDNEFYTQMKNEILQGQFRFIYFNNNLSFFVFKKYTNHFPINIKISFYSNVDDVDNISYNINNDNLISYLLSYLVLSKHTKHILLPIINLDCDYNDIVHIIKNLNEYTLIKKLLLENKLSENICIQVRESYFKNINLNEYLHNNLCEMKILFFQIIHTLAVINEHYKGFVHNNLILDNINIYLKKKSTSYTQYSGFKNDTFYIYNVGFDIKITNFEKAYIPKYYGIKINNKNDLFLLFDNILNKFKHYCDDDTMAFIDYTYPPSIRSDNNSKIILSYKDLLYNKYFSSLLEKPDITYFEETNSNNQYLTGQSSKKKSKKKSNKIIESYNDNYKIYNKRFIKPYSNISSVIVLKRIYQIKKNNKQLGGDSTFIKQRPEKNNPFISNDQKKVNEIKTKENPYREPPVLLEQKLYDTSQNSKPVQQPPPTLIPLYDNNGDIAQKLVPYSHIVNQPPIQKVYNISLSNPIGSYTTLNRIFEDIMPSDNLSFSSLTVYERKQIIDYLRNNLIDKHDGEEMNIKGGNNSLLSYIKIMDINPYSLHTNKFTDLPKNFLLYRAAYPVRFDEKNRQINIAKFSMGINVRIYMLTFGDIGQLIIKGVDSENFDLWREIKYYDWVKQEILRKKVSPNFIAPILYKIDSELKLDWSKIELIKKKTTEHSTTIQLKLNQDTINNQHTITKPQPKSLPRLKDTKTDFISKDYTTSFFYKMLPLQYQKQFLKTHSIKSDNTHDNTHDNTPDKIDLTTNSGKLLVLLTEAPTNNIIVWATPTYEAHGTIKKMLATGYHSKHVWFSVLFQLVYAFAVLHKKGIYIEKFKLEHNVFIKDIVTDLNNIGSWIYKVNNIEYYIPNYGYIVMLDTKYADIDTDQSLYKTIAPQLDKKYKIYGTIYEHNGNKYNDPKKIEENIKHDILLQFKDIINPDNFRNYFKEKGAMPPDEEVLDLITKIWNDKETDICNYIEKYFKIFVHNRVGTLLYKTEIENIDFFTTINFNDYKGKLLINQISTGYEWVLYLGDTADHVPKKKFITIRNGHHVQLDEFALLSYPENEKILPESKKYLKYDENHIYETYVFDNIQF